MRVTISPHLHHCLLFLFFDGVVLMGVMCLSQLTDDSKLFFFLMCPLAICKSSLKNSQRQELIGPDLLNYLWPGLLQGQTRFMKYSSHRLLVIHCNISLLMELKPETISPFIPSVVLRNLCNLRSRQRLTAYTRAFVMKLECSRLQKVDPYYLINHVLRSCK